MNKYCASLIGLIPTAISACARPCQEVVITQQNLPEIRVVAPYYDPYGTALVEQNTPSGWQKIREIDAREACDTVNGQTYNTILAQDVQGSVTYLQDGTPVVAIKCFDRSDPKKETDLLYAMSNQ